MLEIQNVTLTYPDGNSTITAINNVSLSVQQGEITGITGPSGSGKSSLLAVASTLIKPDSGTVVIDGTDILSLSPKKATQFRAEHLGIVFQQANLIASLTVLEQLIVVGEMNSSQEHQKARQRALDLLDATGLGDQVTKRPHQLSGGQRQRVNICRALMNNPAALIIDEPTSALDQSKGREIIELIMRLTKELNTATLLVTHDQSHLPLMDQVITMVDGKQQ